MRYLSICSGIEAASVAWEPLGWKPVGFSEIEPFPSAVLAERWPDIPNLGDLNNYHEWPDLKPDVIVGGTPCQAFSVAGLRQGLADPRGNLSLVFLGLLERYRPRWVVWENVPGVLSDKTGAFGALLGGLGKLGYGFAYRVLNAQYFGVPQRRRRVFVVGYLGDWRRAASVLFEPSCLRGNHPKSSEARKSVTGCLSSRSSAGGGRGVPLLPIAFDLRGRDGGAMPEVSDVASLRASDGGSSRSYVSTSSVRRLTPVECERLQGFPDDHTLCESWAKEATRPRKLSDLIQGARLLLDSNPGMDRREAIRLARHPDGARYKALGNSMAVPVMAWIGKRIDSIC